MIKEGEINEYNLTEFLDNLLIQESETRFNNGVKTKLRKAKFPNKLYLEDYSLDNYNSVQKKLIKEVITLDFLDKKENVLLFGNPGVGKTHLAIGLGTKVCLQNMNVLFISVPNLMIEIKEQMNLNQLQRYRERFERYDLVILDENGEPLKAGDHDRRYFEGPWMHKYNGKYYFSYSTGNTHNICYAIGDNPYGPFTYAGVILTPVVGWTSHHSICEFKGKWYLFFHDAVPSGGKTWLRSIKMIELEYNEDGTIKTIEGGGDW